MSLPEFATNPVGYLIAALLVSFAGYRVARFFTQDSLTDNFRTNLWNFAYDKNDQPRAGAWRTYIFALFDCPHCLGVWSVLSIAVGWYFVGGLWLVVLAAMGLQSFLASLAE